MLPPSLAFAWVLWRQHGWGLFMVLGFLALGAGLSALVPAYCEPYVAANIFGLVIMPIVSLLLYPLCIFTCAFDAGDLLSRESCFPARLFRLPVRTRTLVDRKS